MLDVFCELQGRLWVRWGPPLPTLWDLCKQKVAERSVVMHLNSLSGLVVLTLIVRLKVQNERMNE